ncbi:SDR family NAD(P)-dependent oxidoreductase [Pedobacter hartonius]|uniref:3-oxoacyl-[acyl-carrier protein] reductase n=1 Tax=Pedobacter hartonius TaxID=425514 RepID=A0A1H3W2F9_9SPHI|nr:SDR family NAD(P)-dependent oxidoreductase [Pedobacter hartonius]SDZ81287.1 3-oxoacyl-[acyl-carrier protein] reductase [Pedobacter hartonius]
MELKNKKVLITGGSAGIGKAIIGQLVQHGVQDISVIGRRKEQLEALKAEFIGVNILAIPANVSEATDLDRAVAVISQEWGELDILINCAGVVSAGPLSQQSDEDVIGQINTNLTGLILLTKKTLPLLQKSSEGGLINVSSFYGYVAMPFYSVYAASKAAVGQFSDAMRRELYQYPLHVMTVYPSTTDTEMMKTAIVDKMDTAEDVAIATITGFMQKEINVIMGSKEKVNQIRTNFLEPEKIDQVSAAGFEAQRTRTKNHRSM